MNTRNLFNYVSKVALMALLALGLNLNVQAQCSCTGNLVTNPSFESGTTGWGWSGGTLNQGTGAVACGSFSGDFQISNTASNWVSQEIFPSTYAAGTQLNVNVYAGTHDNSYNHYVSVDFFDANWVWKSNSAVAVNKVLSAAPVGPQLYSWTATVPAGTAHINVSFSGNGNWIKTDGWCVTVATSCNNVTDAGIIGSNESFCGSSFDPSIINNIVSPSGGSGTIEYMWLKSTDGGATNTAISGATGATYDPPTITQTTWYRRCSRRAGCSDWPGESNWVEKSLTCCSCPGNLVNNPSFENGNKFWDYSGGTLNIGTGAVACGTYSGDFQITNTGSNWVSQEIYPTSYQAGTQLSVQVYAGTHDNTYYHEVYVGFFDANWNWLSGSSVQVNKVLSAAPTGPQLYTWTATIPSNVGHVTVGFSGNGNWIKTDKWCVTQTVTCNNLTNAGLIGNDEVICGTSGDPALIQNITTPSGGNTSAAIEYVWLLSYDGGINTQVISGASGATYDPAVITQTSWYRRCARRAGCTDYVGESNWVKKELAPAPTVNAGADQTITCNTASTVTLTATGSSAGTNCSIYTSNVANQTGNVTNSWYSVGAPNDQGATLSRPTTAYAYTRVVNDLGTTIPTGSTVCVRVRRTTTGTSNMTLWLGANGIDPNTGSYGSVQAQSFTNTAWQNYCFTTNANCRYIKITNDGGADFEIDAMWYSCTSTCAITYSWSSGSTTASTTVTPSTTTAYTVTVTNCKGCTATDVAVVNVNKTPPTADAGPDKTLNCSVLNTIIGSASVSGYTYSWSPATGLSSTTIAQPTATPTSTTSYTVTVTNTANGCTATDVVIVNVDKTIPTADAGPDKTLTCTTTSTTIGVASVSGYTYSWSPSTGLNSTTVAQPTVTIGSNTTYTVTVTNSANGCVATDAVNVNVNNTVPTADAGPDKILNCSVTSTTIGTAAVANRSYAWTPASGLSSTVIAQPTATPSATTSYTVVVTNTTNGCTATDVVIVSVDKANPIADAGPDKMINCLNSTVTLGTPAVSGYTYTWSPASGLNATNVAQPVSNVSTPTTYTLTVTNGSNGCTAQDVVFVNYNKTNPNADAGPNKNINCSVSSVVIGTASVTGLSYSWSPTAGLSNPNIAQPTATPSNSTTYTLTVTNGANGCSAQANVNVNVSTSLPDANAGPDQAITCAVASVVIGTPAVANMDYSWSPATGLSSTTVAQPTATPTSSTTYTVTVTNTLTNCTAIDIVNVSVNTVTPTVNAGPDRTINCTSTTTTIGTVAVSGYTYSWSPATGLSSVTAAQPTVNVGTATSYTLTVTNTASSCTAQDVVNVNVDNNPPSSDAGPDKNINCSITSVVIGSAAVANRSYSWSPATGLNATNIAQPTATPSASTTYTVTVTNTTNGCTSTDAVAVTVNKTNPTADAGPDKTLNCTTTTTTIGTASIVGYSYSWSPATGLSATNVAQPVSSATTTTTYTLTVTNLSSGCTAQDVVIVNVNQTPPTAQGGPDKTLNCLITSAVIGTSPLSGYNYSWSPATGLSNATIAQPLASPSATTTYTLTVTNSFNGCSATDVVVVNVNTLTPIADAGIDRVLDCNVLSAMIGSVGNPNYSYSWSPAIGLNQTNIANPIANPTTSQVYTLVVTDNNNGCVSANDQVTVNVNKVYPVITVSGNPIVCNGSTAAMTATTTVGSLMWSTGSTNNTVNLGAGTYQVTATDGICVTTTTVIVENKQGTIGNLVWNDLNADGIFNEPANMGLNGVNVQLWLVGTDNVIGTSDDIFVSTTTTANNVTNNPGYYSFAICNDGNYYVKFPKTIGVNGVLTNSDQTPGVDNNSDPNNQGYSGIININTSGTSVDKDNNTIDAGFIFLASLGNFVWNDVNSNGVQDLSEVGVAGINIALFDGSDRLVATTNTDAYGYYLFSNLIPGNYYVKMTLPANYKATVANTPDDTKDNDFDPITLKTATYYIASNQQDLTIDGGIIFVATPPTTAIGDKVWLDEDKDGVQDPTEAGIAGIVVTLKDNNGNVVASTITDANGNYLFSDVPAGTGYTLVFTPLPQLIAAPKDATTDAADSDIDPITFTTAPFTVVAGVDDLSFDAGFYIQDNTKGTIGDRVWFDANQNGIQDAGENGVGGIPVLLYTAASGSTPVASTVTNELGYYYFNNLTTPNLYYVKFDIPGSYVISPANQGTNDAADSDVPTTGTPITAVIALGAGESNLTIDAGIYTPNLSSLGDRVWYDGNKNGLQDPSENGVAGVLVTLLDASGNPVDGNSSQVGIQPITTTTDANGYYRFDALTPGTYAVLFSNLPVGYSLSQKDAAGATSNSTAGDANDSDADPSNGKTAPVTLVAGQYYSDLDAGIFLGNNAGTGTIGDYVWNDINNNGVQDLGEAGVAGITVTLNQDLNGDGDFNDPNEQNVQTTVTNPSGIYSFTNLVPGTYQVVFSNIPSGYNVSPADQGSNDERDSDGSPIVAGTSSTPAIILGVGEDNLSVDLGLNAPALNSLGNYVWFDINANGIQDAGESGLSGIMVTLLDGNGDVIDRDPLTAGVQAYVTTTDLNGYYIFNGLPDGSYSVLFSLNQGFSITSKDAGANDEADSDVDPLSFKSGVVTLNSANRNNSSIDAGVISINAALGNRVWDDKNGNGIQDPTERGISGVTVTLYDASGNTPLTSMITDANGNYLFTNLTPGTYVVGFSTLPNNTVITVKDAAAEPLDNDNDANPATGKTDPVTLVAGEVNTKIDAGVQSIPPASVGDYVWIDKDLDGIQDPTEKGQAGILVTLYDNAGNPVGSTVTDGNGYYLFTNVTPANGYYVVFSNLPANMLFTTQTTGTSNGSDPNRTTGQTPAFNLLPGEQNTSLDAGLIQLSISLGNYVWNDQNVNGIQDATEVGVAGVTVGLFNTVTNTLVRSTVTDAFGLYRFDNLVPGSYQVAFTLPSNYSFTLPNQGSNDELDSDVDTTNGRTGAYILTWGDTNLSVDAGIHVNVPQTASIGDRVWNDLNADGIQDPNEPGFAGVVVTLLDINLNPIKSTITNGNGNYLFTDLQPGTYTLQFFKPAAYLFSLKDMGTDDEVDSDADRFTGMTDPYVLAAGENNMTVDAGIYYQGNSATIGNFVWNDANNNGIQDPGEAGVQGVTVQLIGSNGTTVLQTLTTNAIGEYYFNGLNAGLYFVKFTNIPNGYVLSASNQGTNDATDSDADPISGLSSVIDLKAGEINVTIDAGIHNTVSTATIGDFVWFDNNQDGIQDPSELGAAGVTVNLLDLSDNILDVTVTDRYGYYLFPDVPAGTYRLSLDNLPEGYVLSAANGGGNDTLDNDFSGLNNNKTTQTYTIANGDVNLTVDGGIYYDETRFRKGSVGNYVWFDANKNNLQDTNEVGVAGVTVTLYAGNGTTIIASTVTDVFGGYIFTDLPEGNFVVGFSNIPSGYVFATPNQGLDDGLDSDADPANSNKTPVFFLPNEGINFTLDAGLQLSQSGLASLGNRVWNDVNQNGLQDPNEIGVSGVVVNLIDNSNNVIATTTSDVDGLYQFVGLQPGMYAVQFSNLPNGFDFTQKDANSNNSEAADSDADPADGKTAFITLSAGQNYVDLDAGVYTLKAGLGNFVWFDKNRNGIQDVGELGVSGVTVTLFDENNVALTSAITDPYGKYSFVNLEPGNYYLRFSTIPQGYMMTLTDAGTNDSLDNDAAMGTGRTGLYSLAAGEYNPTIDAGIVLAGTGTIGNYVWVDVNKNGTQDPSEPGLAGVTVMLLDCSNNVLQSTVTNNDGSYLFANLPEGCYRVRFQSMPVLYNSDGNPMQPAFTLLDEPTTTDEFDSDADASGLTPSVTLLANTSNLTLDAGVVYQFTLGISKLELSATLTNNIALLSWKAEQEENLDRYELERSLDGITFTDVINTQKAKNETVAYYNTTDDLNALANTTKEVFYRVKAIENNQTSIAYSKIVKVSLINNENNFNVYPSPFVDVLNIDYNVIQGNQIKIQIVNIDGKVIYNSLMIVDPFTKTIHLNNLENLSSGNYIIRITDVEANKTTEKQIVKQ